MIRKLLLSTVAIAAISGTAFAADLPSRRAPPVYVPPPIPVFSWTGFYVGGQAGYVFGHDSTALTDPAGNSFSYGLNGAGGVIGGAHIGYNYALPGYGGILGGGLVVGIEADVNGLDHRQNADLVGGNAEYEQTHRNDIDGSARARIGIAVDRALFYATGGAAFTQYHDSFLGSVFTPTTTTFFGPVTGAKSVVGWTAGGGVEYAVTPNWSLRAEYRYTDYGRYSYNVSASLPGATGITGTVRAKDQRVQVGFSYRFADAIAPVVARY